MLIQIRTSGIPGLGKNKFAVALICIMSALLAGSSARGWELGITYPPNPLTTFTQSRTGSTARAFTFDLGAILSGETGQSSLEVEDTTPLGFDASFINYTSGVRSVTLEWTTNTPSPQYRTVYCTFPAGWAESQTNARVSFKVTHRCGSGAVGFIRIDIHRLPVINISTSSISKTILEGTDGPQDIIQLSNGGDDPYSYVLTSTVPWLAVSPVSGGCSNAPVTVQLDYTTFALAPGTYTGFVFVTSSEATNSPRNLRVDLTVLEQMTNIYSITVTADRGGMIQPSGQVLVPHGGNTNFTVQADTNYHIAEVWLDDTPLGIFGPGSNSFVLAITNVTVCHTLHAAFNSAPQIDLSVSPTQGAAPLRVKFDPRSSTDAETNISYTAIDRESDGNYETTVKGAGAIIVEYSCPGIYTSSVKVVDAYGLYASSSAVIEVWGTAPVAELSTSSTIGPAPLTVSFFATNSRATIGHHIVLYEWDFDGDGVTDQITQSPTNNYTYGWPGNYNVALRITDDQGLQARTNVLISVSAPILVPPSVTLAVSPSVGKIPLEVTFTATVSNGSGTVTGYAWDFDADGRVDLTGTNNTVAFCYTLPGTYVASVRATDNFLLAASASNTVCVSEDCNPRVWISTPKDGAHVWGNAISLIGHVAPANTTRSVQFMYKLATANEWTVLGSPLYPPPHAYKTVWNVTNLVDGATYDLCAVAFVGDDQSVTSMTCTVIVDSNAKNCSAGIEEWGEIGNGQQVKTQKLDSRATTTCETSDGTFAIVPVGTAQSDAVMQVRLVGLNTNPLNGSACGQVSIGANRIVSIEGVSSLSQPVTIIIPYEDSDNDAIVDGTSVPVVTLTAHWYDSVSGEWKKPISAEVDTHDKCVKITTYHLTEFGLFGDGNLLNPASGGVLIGFTSEFSNRTSAACLTDGNPCSYWKSSCPPNGPQTFVYGFTNYQGAILTEAVLQNFGETDQGLTNYSREFAIQVGMNQSDFITITNGVLLPHNDPQTFAMNNVTCRYVKLIISGGQNTQGWALAEFAVQGALTADPAGHGVPDWWEIQYFGNFDQDGHDDYDSDGLSNIGEYECGSNPTLMDTDGDGMTDWQEWVAGVSATNANSFFRMEGCDPETNTGLFVFYWDTVTGRLYSVYSITNLMERCWETNVYREPGTNKRRAYTNEDTSAATKFFRLGVELAP